MKTVLIFITSAGFAFLCNLILIPLILKISHRMSWYDEKDHRKVHSGNIPHIGGIGIFFSFLISFLSFYLFRFLLPGTYPLVPFIYIFPLIISLSIIQLVGLIDDFSNMRPLYKFLLQLGAASIVVFSRHTFNEIYIPFAGIIIHLGYFSYPITILWIVGICNAINLVDGIDGLAGGLSAIAAASFACISILQGNVTSAVIGFALFGSIISFLIFNFPPAKIFMGDTGSLFLGFSLASLPLIENGSPHGSLSIILAATVLFIPIFDTFAAILRRIRRKKPISSPDREHTHHKLLEFGLSNHRILLLLYFLSIVFGLIAISSELIPFHSFRWILLSGWIIGILFFLIIDRIFRRRNKLETNT